MDRRANSPSRSYKHNNDEPDHGEFPKERQDTSESDVKEHVVLELKTPNQITHQQNLEKPLLRLKQNCIRGSSS